MAASAIEKSLIAKGNKAYAKKAQGYFKTGPGEYSEGDKFLGIRVPILREGVKQHRNKITLDEIVALLQSDWHEVRMFALFAMVNYFEGGTEKEKQVTVSAYLKNKQRVNNWDLVDCSAYKITGPWFFDKDRTPIDKLVKAKHAIEIACGEESRAALEGIVGGRMVTCQKTGLDAYGRWISTCWTDQVEVNDYMVAIGMALAFRKYDRKYIPTERDARERVAGIHQYQFYTPWEYRRLKRQELITRAAAPQGQECRIKGNINRNEQRIYHLPGTGHYDVTSIKPSQGERWFCTETEAVDSGWKKAGR